MNKAILIFSLLAGMNALADTAAQVTPEQVIADIVKYIPSKPGTFSATFHGNGHKRVFAGDEMLIELGYNTAPPPFKEIQFGKLDLEYKDIPAKCYLTFGYFESEYDVTIHLSDTQDPFDRDWDPTGYWYSLTDYLEISSANNSYASSSIDKFTSDDGKTTSYITHTSTDSNKDSLETLQLTSIDSNHVRFTIMSSKSPVVSSCDMEIQTKP